MEMFALVMNGEEAENIVRDFLGQNYSIIKIEKTELVGHTWIVEVVLSSFGQISTKKVKINSKTGKIMGWV